MCQNHSLIEMKDHINFSFYHKKIEFSSKVTFSYYSAPYVQLSKHFLKTHVELKHVFSGKKHRAYRKNTDSNHTTFCLPINKINLTDVILSSKGQNIFQNARLYAS